MTAYYRACCFALLLSGVSATAFAVGENEPCDCDRYDDLAKISALGSEVALASFVKLHSEGRAFSFSEEDHAALKLKFSAADIVPDHCKRKTAAEKDLVAWTILMRNDFDRPSRVIFDGGVGFDVGFTYHSLATIVDHLCASSTSKDSFGGKAGISTDWCGEKNQHARIRAFLETKRGEAFLKYVSGTNRFEEAVSVSDESRFKVMKAFFGVLASSSEADVLTYLKQDAKNLKTDEKLMLSQIFGALFNSGYDRTRKSGGRNEGGAVTLTDLLRVAKANAPLMGMNAYNENAEMLGSPGLENIPETERAGACRDMASAQAQMLSAMGMPHTYVVAFATTRGRHAVVVTQDPDAPGTIYKINYGSLGSAKGVDASEGLFFGTSDASLNYRIFKPAGRMVAVTASEYGKFVAEAAGFDIRSLDPLSRASSSLYAVEAKLNGEAQTGQVRIFHGKDALEQGYFGAALTHVYEKHRYLQGKIGLVLGTQNLPQEVTGNSDDRNTEFLYVHFENRVQTPSLLNDSKTLSLKAEGVLTGLGGVQWSKGIGLNTQNDLRIENGVRMSYDPQPDRSDGVKSNLYVGAQVASGRLDVRNTDLRGNRLLLNYVVLSAEAQKKLSRSEEAYAKIMATAVCGELGCRGKAEALAVYKDIVGSLGVEGALTKNMAPYVEGVQHRVTAHLLYKLLKSQDFFFDVNGYLSLDDNGSGLMGALKYSH